MRKFFAATLIVLAGAAWAFVALTATDPVPSRPERVMLVYVGAEDCAPCRVWQRGPEVAFQASKEFARLTFREVKSPSLRDVLNEEYWPDDLRVYRDQLNEQAGVPLWLVVADDKVVVRGFGITQWQTTVLPQIKSLLN